MKDFFRTLRGKECIIEYSVEDFCVEFQVSFLNDAGSRGEALELSRSEDDEVTEICWEHWYDNRQEPEDWELRD